MIGAQSVLAASNLDIYCKPPTDSQGRPCEYSPDHNECYDQFFKRTDMLPEILQTSYWEGIQVRHDDFVKDGVYHHRHDNAPYFWGQGYLEGWHNACVEIGNSDEVCGQQEDVMTP